MAGRGPAPDAQRIRRGAPARGEWQPSPDGGWQHPLPDAPHGISPTATEVWGTWFRSWWAGNWSPDDLPSLRFVIRLWDRVDRGHVKRAAELRQWLDGYGVTPKGRQDRRWVKPLASRMGWGSEPDPNAYLRVGGRAPERTSSRFKELIGGESTKERLKRIEREARRDSLRRFEDLIEPGDEA